jgi:hypothetical protein
MKFPECNMFPDAIRTVLFPRGNETVFFVESLHFFTLMSDSSSILSGYYV